MQEVRGSNPRISTTIKTVRPPRTVFVRLRSSMDRIRVSGTLDAGSIPAGATTGRHLMHEEGPPQQRAFLVGLHLKHAKGVVLGASCDADVGLCVLQ